MENILALFAQHGLLAVFLGVFVEQPGAPMPALPSLLLAVATLASMLAVYAGYRQS